MLFNLFLGSITFLIGGLVLQAINYFNMPKEAKSNGKFVIYTAMALAVNMIGITSIIGMALSSSLMVA